MTSDEAGPALLVPEVKRVLLVAHDPVLRSSRLALLKDAGFALDAAASDDEAIRMIRSGTYDLILIGRNSLRGSTPLDERIWASGNTAPVLKIDRGLSVYAHVIGTSPDALLDEVKRAIEN